ncbi:hypothetical protein ZIOFF_007976 [Zingiber officinale]|uniref:Pentatricopeptide repeat-containing protein n=1 Tax=Zingiber officinale TaxID=94328 RepID=A0A8J5HXZ3_ZINOF|nr:hypothetical protein ZIOFF_007976 [Zingiber officinale]
MSHSYFTPSIAHGYATPHTTGMSFTPSMSNELATPTFIPETQFSNRESPIEVVNLDKAISNTKGTRKRSSWTKVEDEVLARSFVTISYDPIIGNDQKADAFLKRVASYYNENRPPSSNIRSANVSIRRLAKCGRPDAVEAILEHHKSFSSDLAHEGFGISLISLYGKAAMPAHAAATFRQLPDLGSTRTVKSFNALLTAYAQSGDLNGLDEAFRDVPDSITPDIISYNILIGALCEKGDLEAAMRTVDLMNTNAISPDLITCNILLHSFYNNKPSEAEKIWAMMRENNIEPNSRSINAKLRWLVAEGRTHEVIELVDQMKRNGPKPDAFTFNALLKGYIQDGNLEEAKKLYLDFAKNECSPNQQTFEFLISYLCEAGELDWAVRCCNDGMSRRCYVRASFLQAVVDALVKNSRVEEAKKLVEAGWNNRYPKTSLGLPESTQSLVV